MTINTIFSIVACVSLCASVALAIILVREYLRMNGVFLEAHPGLHASAELALMMCIAVGIAFLILSVIARECPTCDIIVTGNYCEECGLQVRDLDYPDNLFCPECGDEISDKANFCGNCGTKVNHE